MSRADRAGLEEDPDAFLSLLGVSEDGHGALADMETFLQFSPPPTNPQPLHQNYPRTPYLPLLGEFVVQDFILPDTPLEPFGPQESYTGCLAGLGECDAWSSLGTEGDTVFRFPAISDSSVSSAFQSMLPPLVPPGFDEASCMDTPPDTPTDPRSLFDGFSGQQPALGQCPPSSSTTPFLSLFPAPPPPPPHRQRLQGTSLMEDGDLQDLDILEDLSVFSDSEMPAPDHTDTSSGCFQPSEAEGGQEPAPAVQAAGCVDPPARQERKGLRLKQELRQKIIQNRLDNGQGEMKVDFTEGPVYQMTAEDEARRNVRRAQNRGAAQRFRQRKKVKEEEMRKECEEKKQTNSRLRREVKQLRAEVARLEAELRQHRHCGLGGWDRPPPPPAPALPHDLPRTAASPPSYSLDVLGGGPAPPVLP